MSSKAILDDIRSRLSIVTLVGEHLPLKKSGRHFKGLCPFHQEKTPSFMVSEEKQIFHCFGCGNGGDIFTFVMKIDGLTFPEVVKSLAQRTGVKLPNTFQKSDTAADAEWERRKKWAARLSEIAKDLFAQNLKNAAGQNARRYLEERKIAPETAETFKIGLALSSWDQLYQLLKEHKAPLTLAENLGLLKKSEKTNDYFDFFRERIIFPIFDARNQLVGFGGRTLKADDMAKYINSPDSFLYNKTRTVYGLNWAKDSIHQQDEVILVEGYIDLISMHQAGIKQVVAPCGTALTEEHIKLLLRHTRNFSIAFDGDKAGQNAAFRSLPIFLALGLTPKFILFPDNMDPDNFIHSEGPEGFDRLKKKAPTLFEAYMDFVIRQSGEGTQAALKAW